MSEQVLTSLKRDPFSKSSLTNKTGIYSFWHSWCAALICALLCATVQAEEIEFMHGISLLHELKYPKDFEHFEYANPDAPKGGKIVFSTTSNIVNFNGARGPSLPNAVGLGRTFDRLLIRTADELSGLYGNLVGGIALSEDKTKLYMRLHEHARWHDGVPITTADIKFTYDEMMTMVHGKVYFDSWLKEMEFVGPRDIVLHHRSTFTNANLIAMTWFPVRPAHYWEGKDSRKPTLVPPVGSGPYQVADFDRNYVRYVRNPNYWGRDLPINKGRYNFDEIVYEVYRDRGVAREGFRKGLFDITFETDIHHWISSYELPAVENGWLVKDTREVRKFIGAERAIALNTNREILRDVRVREALTIALDFEWQNRVMRHSTQSRSLSYFSNSRFAATGRPEGEELKLLQRFGDQVPERALTEPLNLPVSTGFGSNRAALARAQELLADAGWQLINGRLLDEAGNPFELEILTQDQTMQRVLLPYTGTLQMLGIDARMRLVDNVTAINLIRSRTFDAYVRELFKLNPPVGELRNFVSSTSADMQASANMTGVRDPVVDALVDLAEKAKTIEEMTVVCRALDRVLFWGFYHVPLNKADSERFLYWNKFNRASGEAVAKYEYLVGSSVRVLDSWWYDPDKASQLPTVQN